MKLQTLALVLIGVLTGITVAHIGPQVWLSGDVREGVQTLSSDKVGQTADQAALEASSAAHTETTENSTQSSAAVLTMPKSTDATLERLEGDDTRIDEVEFRREQHEIEMVLYEEEIQRLNEESLANYRPDSEAPKNLTPGEQLARDQEEIEDYLWEVEVENFAAPGEQSEEN